MRSKADVVIIGGGIIGMSVAFYLSCEKYGQIVLVEKEPVAGGGATSKAAGGIRAQFSSRVNIEMSMLSETIFARFQDETGYKALFDQVGYMFLLEEENDKVDFKQAVELQLSLGLKVELLEHDDILKHAPHVSVEENTQATVCFEDGLGDPHEFLSGYEKAARANGVEIEFDAEVTGITTNGAKVNSVQTSRGTIDTPLVINCAGPQAKLIGQLAGVKVRVEPIRRQIVTTGKLTFPSSRLPMVVDVKSGLYCHKESHGLLMGWADRAVKPSFDTSIDPDYTDAIIERALNRIPLLETAEIANKWAGLYETTPDHHAIIGWEPELEGMFHVVGFSGHGFMQAPAAGIVTTEMIVGKPLSVDVSAMAPERFASGVLIDETNVI